MALTTTDFVPLKSIYDPISEVPLPTIYTGVVDATATAPLSYGTIQTIYWNTANKFSNPGQNWVIDTVGNVAKGCRNQITSRTTVGTRYGAVTDFEFIIEGDKFGVAFQSHGNYDTQIYIGRLG